MDQQQDFRRRIHFHIRWAGVARLDWEPFQTLGQALLRATELGRPGESFQLVEADDSCPRCKVKVAAAS